MSAPKPSAGPMAFVYDGQRCLSFVFQPRQLGFETLNSDERSLGFFQTQCEAATAVMRGNHQRSISRNR